MSVAHMPPGHDFRAGFEAIAAHDKEKDTLIDNTLKTLEHYEQQLQALKSQLNTARLQLRYQEKSRNNFVVVLVDGDGAVFLKELLENPRIGANEAARRLSQNIQASLRKSGVDTDDVTILVRIFANLCDLSKMLHLTNVIGARQDLNTFAEQFTVSRGEFDFINVGPGKENADSKIRYMLNHFYTNLQCKQIFFVGCHDAGYVNELQKYTDDPARIILVQTTPAQPSFASLLPFEIIQFDNVFRSTSLTGEDAYPSPVSGSNSPERPTPVRPALPVTIYSPPEPNPVRPPLNTSQPQTQPHTRPVLVQKTTTRTEPAYTSINPNLPLAQPQPQPHQSQWSNIISSGNGGVSVRYPSKPPTPPTYASAGGGTHQNIVLQTSKGAGSIHTIEYNSDGQRLDTPNRKPTDQSGFDSYYLKLQKVKSSECRGFCNYKYLQGACRRGASCPMEHDIVLSDKELAVHRYRARLGQCTNGDSCSDFGCFFSHHCPYAPNCTNSECKFEVHLAGKDLEAWQRWTEGKPFPDTLRQA